MENGRVKSEEGVGGRVEEEGEHEKVKNLTKKRKTGT